MDEPTEGREARLDRERISQGEDADRGEREHPADDDQHRVAERLEQPRQRRALYGVEAGDREGKDGREDDQRQDRGLGGGGDRVGRDEREQRSEEHTSELQSLMRISYAVFC